MIEKDTVVVFTARSPGRIVEEGGSQSWVLNPARAKLCKWLVCTQNRHNPDHDFSDATESHGSAFLIGKVFSITQSSEEGSADRWLIQISEFAYIDVPEVWKHWRNPVRYAYISELGINVDEIEFQVMPEGNRPQIKQEKQEAAWPPATLTILEAKKALAATFGVKPDAVEIIIRG